jgi:nicotinate-nucleotide pyrophosphorylase (carboxylating)
MLADLDSTQAREQIARARELSPSISIEIASNVTLENVRAFAEAGADLIRVDGLTQSVRAASIQFQIQPG